MTIRSAAGSALLLAALAGCGAVKVTPSEGAAAFSPRPKGCPLEFLRKPPQRPYQELGELQAHVTAPPPGGAQEVLRDDACALGADAVILTRNFVTNEFGHVLVAGVAIKYVEPPPLPPREREEERPPAPGSTAL